MECRRGAWGKDSNNKVVISGAEVPEVWPPLDWSPVHILLPRRTDAGEVELLDLGQSKNVVRYGGYSR